jgi:DNA-binding MarR family transcriptional regulator
MRNINAPRNDNVGRSNGIAGERETAAGLPAERARLEGAVLDAMTSFSPRDRGLLKSWHRHAISLVHVNVLTSLDIEGPLSMRRLAETMDVSNASATGIVDRMEKRGLVERRHDEADRRVVIVCPTEQGRQVFRDIDAHRRLFLGQVLARLTDGQLRALGTGMEAVLDARRQVLESLASATDADHHSSDTASRVLHNPIPSSSSHPAETQTRS